MNDTVFKTCLSFLISAIIVAAFSSSSLVTWAYDLEHNTFSNTLVLIVEAWDNWMDSLGLTDISEAMRRHISVIIGE